MPGRSGGVCWLISNLLLGAVTNTNKFDFGLTENELLLRDLHTEDLRLAARLEEANERLHSEELASFLEKEQFPGTGNFTQHPINVFHLIKKHSLATNNLLLRLGEGEVKEKILELRNETDLIRTLRLEDLKRSMSALAVMIHSYHLDLEAFARGEIPANTFGSGGRPLLATRPLTANDLGRERDI